MNTHNDKAIKAIITGSTGMVGEGVMHECLEDDRVEQVLVVNRKPCGVEHPKLKELICPDFFDLSAIEDRLAGYDACFFCLGVSSVGMSEEKYTRLTYDLTMHFAKTLVDRNPDMVFCYVSGAGTDNTEKGRSMWARVKGKTENDLQQLPFKAVYNFRPGIITPTKGLKNTLSYYTYLGWLLPIIEFVAPRWISSLKAIGRAMINVVVDGYGKPVLEVPDIKEAARA